MYREQYSANIAEYANILCKISNGLTFLTCHLNYDLGQWKNKSEEFEEKCEIYAIRKKNYVFFPEQNILLSPRGRLLKFEAKLEQLCDELSSLNLHINSIVSVRGYKEMLSTYLG